MTKSTAVLGVFLLIIGLGAIIVAREFRTTMRTPAGLRMASKQRLQVLADAIGTYRQIHGTWPDNTFQVLRDRRLGLGAAGGVIYRRPSAASAADDLLAWREEPLPGVRQGEPWGGPDKLASRDMPPVGHVITVGLQVVEMDLPAFRARTQPVDPAAGPAP